MMKKSLLAMAVAGAVAAPQAGAVTTLYGAVNQTLSQVESTVGNTDYSSTRVHDNNSKLGVKGSEDLGGGMSAIFKIEYGLGLNGKSSQQTNYKSGSISGGHEHSEEGDDDTDDDNLSDENIKSSDASHGLNQRNAFVGLKGGFGTFLIGRHDVPAKIALGKVAYAVMGSGSGHALNGNANIGFSNHIRANNTLAYISPNFSGFTVSLATIAGEAEDAGTGADIADGPMEGGSLGIMYSNGPIYAGVGYTSLSEELVGGERNIGGLALKYAPSNWEVGYLFESDEIDDGDEAATHYLYGGMKFGANKVYLQYGFEEVENGTEYDRTAYGVAFKHSLSKRSSFWAAYTAREDDSDAANFADNEASMISLGLTHKF